MYNDGSSRIAYPMKIHDDNIAVTGVQSVIRIALGEIFLVFLVNPYPIHLSTPVILTMKL